MCRTSRTATDALIVSLVKDIVQVKLQVKILINTKSSHYSCYNVCSLFATKAGA